MKLVRPKQKPSPAPVELPEVGESVTLVVGAGRIPARVIERTAEELTVAITVRARPLDAKQLNGLVVERASERGRTRLTGVVAQDPADPEVVRLRDPRSLELLQQREYVRIRSARPALVFSARNHSQVQSFTVDVSGGGLLLAGPDSLAVGDELTFRLTLTPGVTPVTGRGRVVRIDTHGRRAVEFVQISDLDRRRLVRFLFQCQRAELRRGLDSEDRRG